MDIYWLQNGNKYSTFEIKRSSGKQVYNIYINFCFFYHLCIHLWLIKYT